MVLVSTSGAFPLHGMTKSDLLRIIVKLQVYVALAFARAPIYI